MKKLIGLLIGCIAGVSQAADADLATFYARDNTGYGIYKHSATWREGPVGIRLQTSRFTGASESLGAGGDIQWGKGNLYIDGHAAVMSNSGKNYVDGDINAVYSINDRVTLNLGVSADTIAGPTITPGTVNFGSASIGIEQSTPKFGALVSGRYLWRTDGNNQSGWLAKGWWNAWDGVNVYITHREFSNSQIDPNYFSPLTYRRTAVGISARRSFGPVAVSASFEPGSAKINGENTATKLYKFEAAWKIMRNAKLIYSIGRDYGANGAYVYTFNMLTVRATF